MKFIFVVINNMPQVFNLTCIVPTCIVNPHKCVISAHIYDGKKYVYRVELRLLKYIIVILFIKAFWKILSFQSDLLALLAIQSVCEDAVSPYSEVDQHVNRLRCDLRLFVNAQLNRALACPWLQSWCMIITSTRA